MSASQAAPPRWRSQRRAGDTIVGSDPSEAARGDSAPVPSRPLFSRPVDGHDLAGGSDDRSVKEAVGLVVSPQDRLDPPPQLRIGRALLIQDDSPVRDSWLSTADWNTA